MNRSAIKLLQAIARGHLKTSDREGFTLIELIVVVVIIGVLAAIAAPGWIGFMNNRRASSVNDAVLQALNEARNKAVSEKLAYSVSFRTENDIPQIAIYPITVANISDAAQQGYWEIGDVSNDVDIKANQILIQTNIADRNEQGTNLVALSNNPTNFPTITFEHTGELALKNDGDIADTNSPNQKGLIVQVSVPNSSNLAQPIASTIRCVRVQTLLGSLVIGRTQSECE